MKSTPLILTVVSNRCNLDLLAQFLYKQGYQSFGATSIEAFELALTKRSEIALVLVDISGFDSHIWKLCELLQNAPPELVISPRQSTAIHQESLAYGARSMLLPLVVRELLRFIQSLLGE